MLILLLLFSEILSVNTEKCWISNDMPIKSYFYNLFSLCPVSAYQYCDYDIADFFMNIIS